MNLQKEKPKPLTKYHLTIQVNKLNADVRLLALEVDKLKRRNESITAMFKMILERAHRKNKISMKDVYNFMEKEFKEVEINPYKEMENDLLKQLINDSEEQPEQEESNTIGIDG